MDRREGRLSAWNERVMGRLRVRVAAPTIALLREVIGEGRKKE